MNNREIMLAAKLNVLIEGIADHKMDTYNREMLSREIVADIKDMCCGSEN